MLILGINILFVAFRVCFPRLLLQRWIYRKDRSGDMNIWLWIIIKRGFKKQVVWIREGFSWSVHAPMVCCCEGDDEPAGSRENVDFFTNWETVALWRRNSLKNGMLRRVTFRRTDVREELSAPFIRMTRIGEIGTTLAVTSNRRALRRNTTYWYWYFFAACVGC
jgi:hypothetical protein